jgi:hypothetical protein
MEAFFDLPLVAGLDEAGREESRDPAAGFRRLENTEQAKRGALTKRPGTASLGAPSANAPACLAPHRDSALTLHDGQQLFSFAAGAWTSRGRVPMLATERRPLVAGGVFRGTTVYDVASVGGFTALLYEGPHALFAMVYDATTLAPFLGPERLDPGLTPGNADVLQEFRATLVVVGGKIIALYNRENVVALTREDEIRFRIFDTANPSAGWAPPASLIGPGIIDLTFGRFLFDAVGLTTRFAIAYLNVAVGITVATYDDTGAFIASASAFVGAPGTTNTFSVDGTETEILWMARSRTGTSGVDVEAHDPVTLANMGTALLGMTSRIGGGEVSDGVGSVAMVRLTAQTAKLVVSGTCNAAGYARPWVAWLTFANAAGTTFPTDGTTLVHHIEATNKPFVRDGRALVVVAAANRFDTPPAAEPFEVAFATNRERCMWVIDVTSPREGDATPQASLAPRVNGTNGMLYAPRYLRQVAVLPDGAHAVVYPSLRSPTTEVLELAELRTVTKDAWAEVGSVTAHQGWSYDGNRPLEMGFVQTPRVKFGSFVGAGALTGNFLYTAVWEHEDSAGNTHFSAPAAPILVSPATQNPKLRVTSCTLSFRALRDTGADRVRAVLYRTPAGGTTYYRCAETNVYEPSLGLANGFGAFVEFTDSMSDATLTQRARLYTQPGTPGTSLPRRSPPGLVHIVQHGDVLAGIADDRRTIVFSAPRVGGEGTWWQDFFVVEVEDTTPLVALASFDSRLVAFTRGGVWMIDGTGFAENGAGGYSIPQRIPSDVGCSEPRSVVVTPAGALFRSDLGLCMLSRGGQVVFFGELVSTTLEAFPEVTSATLEADQGRVLFSLRALDGTGAWLVYDYVANVWLSQRRTDLAAATAACSLGGAYHYALTNAAVYRVTPGTYLDGPSWVGQTIETGWIKLSGLQGYQRIRRLLLRFARRSAFELRVSLGYDYQDGYTEVRDYDQGDIDALPAPQLVISPARQKCQAIRVRLEELAPVTSELASGQGFELVGVRVAFEQKRRPGFSASQKG